jgi:hypothetical protein
MVVIVTCQVAVMTLSKALPEGLGPLPLDLVRINDTRSDIVPNGGDVLVPGLRVVVTVFSSIFLIVVCFLIVPLLRKRKAKRETG